MGTISGFAGELIITIIDEMLLKVKVVRRSLREMAAGLFSSSRFQAMTLKQQIFGQIVSLVLCILGGISILQLLTLTGTRFSSLKGILCGAGCGSLLTSFLNKVSKEKIRPENYMNFSFLFIHAVFGLIVSIIVRTLGDQSLFEKN